MLAKKINGIANLQALLPFAHNGCVDYCLSQVILGGECSHIEIVSNMQLCNCGVGKSSKFIAYSLMGCIVFIP